MTDSDVSRRDFFRRTPKIAASVLLYLRSAMPAGSDDETTPAKTWARYVDKEIGPPKRPTAYKKRIDAIFHKREDLVIALGSALDAIRPLSLVANMLDKTSAAECDLLITSIVHSFLGSGKPIYDLPPVFQKYLCLFAHHSETPAQLGARQLPGSTNELSTSCNNNCGKQTMIFYCADGRVAGLSANKAFQTDKKYQGIFPAGIIQDGVRADDNALFYDQAMKYYGCQIRY